MSRRAAAVAALACVAAAGLLLLLAVDVGRWRDALASSDVRYRSSPGAARMWEPDTLVVPEVLASVLGVEDDVAFRRALRDVRLGRLDVAGSYDPALVAIRADATARLTDVLRRDGLAARRAAAANLLGVLTFVDSLAGQQDAAALLAASIGRFRQAIALDPANEDAKHNLELALARGTALGFAESAGGKNASPGGRGARGAGAGKAGSGY